MAKALTSEEKNAQTMLSSLQKLEIHDIDLDGMKAVLRNKPDPYSMSRWTMIDENKIKLQVKFDKSFSIDHYVATFVPKLPVDHAIINGVDTKALEERMESADWYYASESSSQLEKEYDEIEKIEADINQLIRTPEGLHVATILWNNHVPFYAATKPDLISRYEDNGDFYVKQKFSGDTAIHVAYEKLQETLQLKLQQEVNDKFEDLQLSRSSDISDVHFLASSEVHEIIPDDPATIRKLIHDEMLMGNEWIAFNSAIPVLHAHNLNFFKTDFDVAEFVYENTTDRDFVSKMPIQEFEIQLEKWEAVRRNPDVFKEFVDSKLQRADWNYKESDNYNRFYEGEKEIGQINYLLSLVKKDVGIEKANALWDQYASNAIQKPIFLTEKNTVMTEQELSQNRREFGLIGASEAFNEDLIKQMKDGVPKIEHHFPTKNPVTGDEANTIFYLNKSDRNNLYFLNKWDVTVKKFGTEEPVKMTFYNNDLKRVGHVLKNPEKLVTTFTHSRAINYLAGRPVLNTYKNQNDKIKRVWDQAYPNEKLLNGNMKTRSYHEEYGFDLRKVGDEYRMGIKSLSNAEHAERFYQSLERGNLEKATFVEKNGKEVPYYVTPNIQVGYLEVYTSASAKAVALTPEQLLEKGFISQEFALKVRERINQIEREKQTQRHTGNSENRLKENPRQGGTSETLKETQVQKQASVSQKSLKESQTIVPDKKLAENVGKQNNRRQKVNGEMNSEAGKRSRKIKPKLS